MNTHIFISLISTFFFFFSFSYTWSLGGICKRDKKGGFRLGKVVEGADQILGDGKLGPLYLFIPEGKFSSGKGGKFC